jgi:hypothetical protein
MVRRERSDNGLLSVNGKAMRWACCSCGQPGLGRFPGGRERSWARSFIPLGEKSSMVEADSMVAIVASGNW